MRENAASHKLHLVPQRLGHVEKRLGQIFPNKDRIFLLEQIPILDRRYHYCHHLYHHQSTAVQLSIARQLRSSTLNTVLDQLSAKENVCMAINVRHIRSACHSITIAGAMIQRAVQVYENSLVVSESLLSIRLIDTGIKSTHRYRYKVSAICHPQQMSS